MGRHSSVDRRGTWQAWVVIGLVVLCGCSSDSDSGSEPPEDVSVASIMSNSTWPIWSTPEDAGFSTTGLNVVAAYTRSLNTTGLVVVVSGQVLHAQGNVTELSYVASVRKSILSMLYGIAVNNGDINLDLTVNDLGLDDVQGLLPIEKQARIYDLITVRSGVYHPASNGGSDTVDVPERGSKLPGTYFYYNNWDFNIAGAIFEMETGRNIYDALRDDLAIPLEMEDFDRSAQMKSGDLTQSQYPAYHIWLSTRDMVRIGELMLRGGNWNGTQLVPADWIGMSTTAITPLEEMNPAFRRDLEFGFGVMWWVWDGPLTPLEYEGAFTARGFAGQYITVIPALDMVIAHKTAVGDGRGFDRQTRFSQYRGVLERLLAARLP